MSAVDPGDYARLFILKLDHVCGWHDCDRPSVIMLVFPEPTPEGEIEHYETCAEHYEEAQREHGIVSPGVPS